jgi:hypothetical protein
MLFFFLLSWLWLSGMPGASPAGPPSSVTDQDQARPNGPKLRLPGETDGTNCCGPDVPPPKPPTDK